HFGASAGRADARRRDAVDVGHRRGAATKQMPAAAPLRAAARRPAGFVARSSHTAPDAPGIARRSRLASGPGGLQQNVKLFLREPLACAVQPEGRTPNLAKMSSWTLVFWLGLCRAGLSVFICGSVLAFGCGWARCVRLRELCLRGEGGRVR